MLGDGQELDVGEPQAVDVGNELVSQLAIGQGPVLLIDDAHPRA